MVGVRVVKFIQTFERSVEMAKRYGTFCLWAKLQESFEELDCEKTWSVTLAGQWGGSSKKNGQAFSPATINARHHLLIQNMLHLKHQYSIGLNQQQRVILCTFMKNDGSWEEGCKNQQNDTFDWHKTHLRQEGGIQESYTYHLAF